MGVKVTVDRVDALVRSINSLTKQQVVVGIPEENANRDPQDGDAINNAALLYIHELGSPAANIPARPTLIPGMRAYQDRAIVRLKAAANAAMDDAARGAAGAERDVSQVRPTVRGGSGDDKPAREVTAQLNAIGLEAVVSVKKQFTDGALAPLKPATIAARKRAGFAGEKPLIRTADLMRHINYAIRKTK
jgi:hypothetical protein